MMLKETIVVRMIIGSIRIYGMKAINKLIYTIYKITKGFIAIDKMDCVMILPHEGLGDLIAILPALQNINKSGVKISLLTDISKWTQIENTFINVPKVKIIHFNNSGKYEIPQFLKKSDGSSLKALGFYSNFPVVDYPSSFFWQLGVHQNQVANFLQPKLSDKNFNLPIAYDFIDLNTSKGNASPQFIETNKNTLTSLSNTEILIKCSETVEILILKENSSFHEKICIALKSEKVICSDAALFNALIRFEKRPKLIVHTRKHSHSHCTEIYQNCKFDGRVYEFPARH